MKSLLSFLLIALLSATTPGLNDSSQVNDSRIAQAIRKAVRDADPALLQSSVLGNWREYLKIAAMDLDLELQPLVLIKFDEDISFRNQLKSLIEWERDWQKQETEHYRYYFQWDHPLPGMILEVQEVHFKEVTQRFQIDAPEKIPYRYDQNANPGTVYPFDDLRGGIVSSQPFDLEKAALAILYFIDPEPPSIIQPLGLLYGSFFQNDATSRSYYKKCLQQIGETGYLSALEIYQNTDLERVGREWASSYAFVYDLNQEFGPAKLAQFLKQVNCRTEPEDFLRAFREVFAAELSDFETRYKLQEAVNKL